MKKVDVQRQILTANDYVAEQNKEFFNHINATVLNIMASPGAGKTSVILQTIKNLPDLNILVIEGDIAGDIDARKVEELGVPAIQINTGGGCHLNASMIQAAIERFPEKIIDLVLIENVGNLICPAQFNLGEDFKVVILSVPEGHDKPLKYPIIFQNANLVLLNKIDLLSLSDFDMTEFTNYVKRVNPEVEIIRVSCKTGEGIDKWIECVTASRLS